MVNGLKGTIPLLNSRYEHGYSTACFLLECFYFLFFYFKDKWSKVPAIVALCLTREKCKINAGKHTTKL